MKYIEVENVSFSYDTEQVLNNISFHVNAGEFAILTGENGAAKSTLLRLILGLLKSQQGKASIAKTNAKGQSMLIGYAPQQIASFNIGFPSTVYDLVASGRCPNGKWFKKFDAHDKEHIEKALKSVGMWEMREKRIGELSGGQKQRIFLARLFATDPDVFILDEPTTGMDIESRKQFYHLLQHSCHGHGKAVLMVTHEDGVLDNYVDKHIHLVRDEQSPWRCFSMRTCQERSKK